MLDTYGHLYLKILNKHMMSRNVVSIAARQQAVQSGVRISVRARDSSLFQNVLTGSGIPPVPYLTGTGVLLRA
jgi:hypothetical protein